uniref:3D domain-containing protein n=1 Tax=Prasinoderma singulare TaxID=676789 RepID=A0A7S3BY41_9VIRI
MRETHAYVHTTAYCNCGLCCGWEWGVTLGSAPAYLPLCTGQRRASGTRTIPLVPRRRRRLPNGKDHPYGHRFDPQRVADHARGALLGIGLGVGAGLGLLACRYSLFPGGARLVSKGSLDILRKESLTREASAKGWRAAKKAAAPYLSIGALAGGTVGAQMLPVRRYWAETSLQGMPYTGHTATGDRPRSPRASLLSLKTLQTPWTIPLRLVTFQWGAVDGTIAADTDHHPFGTRVFVPGYGWGTVADRGSMVAGATRLDLFHDSHREALRWGKKTIVAKILHSA